MSSAPKTARLALKPANRVAPKRKNVLDDIFGEMAKKPVVASDVHHRGLPAKKPKIENSSQPVAPRPSQMEKSRVMLMKKAPNQSSQMAPRASASPIETARVEKRQERRMEQPRRESKAEEMRRIERLRAEARARRALEPHHDFSEQREAMLRFEWEMAMEDQRMRRQGRK